MKNAIFIIAVISAILAIIEIVCRLDANYSFIKAINNFFTYTAIIALTIYLYINN